jgi:hypothetical protein
LPKPYFEVTKQEISVENEPEKFFTASLALQIESGRV